MKPRLSAILGNSHRKELNQLQPGVTNRFSSNVPSKDHRLQSNPIPSQKQLRRDRQLATDSNLSTGRKDALKSQSLRAVLPPGSAYLRIITVSKMELRRRGYLEIKGISGTVSGSNYKRRPHLDVFAKHLGIRLQGGWTPGANGQTL